MQKVYISKTSRYLPNEPVSNEEMEAIIGLHNGSKRIKNMILRSNGIETRYYALNSKGEITHTNAELSFAAIKKLFGSHFKPSDLQLVSVGTTTPDQNLPSHAAMVHGLMDKDCSLEINSASGACSAGMSAFKYGYLSVLSANTQNAIVVGSERTSTWMNFNKFEEELSFTKELEKNGILSFQKEFIRWMLSDGAGAFLLENKINPASQYNLEVNWVDGVSYANELETCMYAGADKTEEGQLIPWSHFAAEEWAKKSIFSIKQDVKLLEKNIIDKGVQSLEYFLKKHDLKGEEINYFLPHISSFFFKDKLMDAMQKANLGIGAEKWFTNLKSVGNVGAGSIFIMLDELLESKTLKKGDKILLSVPESARFNYMSSLLTVV